MNHYSKPPLLNYILRYRKPPPKTFLMHHGVEGQKWGVRRGPPYPLSEEKRESSEKAVASDLKSDTIRSRAERDLAKQKTSSIKKGLRNLQTCLAEHESKIKNPSKYYPEWDSLSDREKAGSIRHWEKEIRNFKRSIESRIAELKRRGDNDE